MRDRDLMLYPLPIERCQAVLQLPHDLTQEEAIKVARFAMAIANMDPSTFPKAPPLLQEKT